MPQLSELRSRTRSLIGLPTDDEFITDAEINTAINAGLREMASDFDWPWLQKVVTWNTVPQQQVYSFSSINASDLVRIQSLYTSSDTINGFALTSRQFPFIVSFLNIQPSMPSDFSVVADSLYLAPIPNSVYPMTMLYICFEPTLSADSDTSLVPEQYSDVPCVYAAIWLAAKMQDQTRQQIYLQMKQDWIQRVSKNVIRTTVAPAIVQRDDW